MEEQWYKLNLEFEKWRCKYINYENYMEGRVCHYTSSFALENILKSKTLWVTKSDFLNDKTEFTYTINLVNKLYDPNKYKYLDKAMLIRVNKEIKTYLSRSFIFSTSQNADSVNLWSNYSKSEGYNIEFNLRRIFNRMLDGKIYIAGNNRLNDGKINKYIIERKDQHKSISMSPGKVVYDKVAQENIILDILSFLEHISETYYLYSNEIKGYAASKSCKWLL